jgi:hypothetical protein
MFGSWRPVDVAHIYIGILGLSAPNNAQLIYQYALVLESSLNGREASVSSTNP